MAVSTWSVISWTITIQRLLILNLRWRRGRSLVQDQNPVRFSDPSSLANRVVQLFRHHLRGSDRKLTVAARSLSLIYVINLQEIRRQNSEISTTESTNETLWRWRRECWMWAAESSGKRMWPIRWIILCDCSGKQTMKSLKQAFLDTKKQLKELLGSRNKETTPLRNKC